MMGQQPPQQNALFYDFCLERHIPNNHLLRHIDSFLDFSEIRKHLESFYSHTGRPSIDPELMIRMLLIGYCYGIRSERRLCEEINFNLAYRWFCGLGLEAQLPDHSTFSKNRHGRFRESDIFRMVFNTVVRRCMKQGLVKGEGFAIDASVIRADASRQNYKNTPIDWTPEQTQNRAVKEYLESLDIDSSLTKPNRNTSLADPMSQWSAIKGPAQFYYSTNYMIDVEHGIILDVEASMTNHASEVATTEIMIERIEENHGILPNKLMGDTAYGAAKNLNYLVTEKNIEPHIPVWDKSSRKDNTLCRDDFVFIEEDNQYLCPEGKRLSTTGNATSDKGVIYRSRNLECVECPLKERCCPNTPNRKITRSVQGFLSTCAKRETSILARSVSPLFGLRNKVDGLKFLGPQFKPIIALFDQALSGLSQSTSGTITGDLFVQLVGTLNVLSSRSQMQKYLDGNINIDLKSNIHMELKSNKVGVIKESQPSLFSSLDLSSVDQRLADYLKKSA